MIKRTLILAIAATLALLLAACTPDISQGTYNVSGINTAQDAYPGTIINASPVAVNAENSQTGTAIGAIAGGVAGSAIGGDTRTNILGALGGAVVGGVAGQAIGKHVGNQTGMRYIVKLDTGKTVSVVQGMQPVFQVRQRVIVLMGGDRPRVVAAN